MKLISLDVETTGLRWIGDQLLSVAAVKLDTETMEIGDSLNIFIPRVRIEGSPIAINMNQDLIELNANFDRKELKEFFKNTNFTHVLQEGVWTGLFTKASYLSLYGTFVPTLSLDKVFRNFVGADEFIALGKNFDTFDKPFINEQTNMFGKCKPHRRSADPSALWVKPEDNKMPSLDVCMQRAGIAGGVTHDALQDAIDTANVYMEGLKRLG